MSNSKYHIFVDNVKDRIICPITREIMYEPVKANDGMTYERDAILQWLKNNNTSPITGKVIDKNLIPCITTKCIINDFFELRPDLISEQYVPMLEDYHINLENILKIIRLNLYNDLRRYTNFYLIHFLENVMTIEDFLKNCSFDVQKHIIDNSFNLDVKISYTKNSKKVSFRFVCWIALFGSLEIFKYIMSKNIKTVFKKNTLAHIVCGLCREEIVKYFITCDIDFGVKNFINNKPIHLLLKRVNISEKIIRNFIDLEVGLESKGCGGNKPIHIAIKNVNISNDTIIYLIEKGIKLNCPNNKNIFPIHIACNNEYLRHDLILYLLKTNINFECCDNDNWRPIHYLCNGNDKVLIKKIIDKGVDLECETSDGRKPIHLLAKPSTVTSLKYIIQKNVRVDDIENESDVIAEKFGDRINEEIDNGDDVINNNND
jgi:ankyrin repeat protein